MIIKIIRRIVAAIFGIIGLSLWILAFRLPHTDPDVYSSKSAASEIGSALFFGSILIIAALREVSRSWGGAFKLYLFILFLGCLGYAFYSIIFLH